MLRGSVDAVVLPVVDTTVGAAVEPAVGLDLVAFALGGGLVVHAGAVRMRFDLFVELADLLLFGHLVPPVLNPSRARCAPTPTRRGTAQESSHRLFTFAIRAAILTS